MCIRWSPTVSIAAVGKPLGVTVQTLAYTTTHPLTHTLVHNLKPNLDTDRDEGAHHTRRR